MLITLTNISSCKNILIKMKKTIVLMIFINLVVLSTLAQNYHFSVDFEKQTGTGSPYVFGATQPRGLSDDQWDQLKEQGFTLARSQADLTHLVPCKSPEDYKNNKNGCAEPENWDWKSGIYGDDFVSKAAERGMKVILTYKNATWNRHEGTPEDEETIPRDFNVWQDILTKIINHYKGAVTYLELYNEVDREPQFLVQNSGYTRKEGYKTVLKKAIEAVKNSDYPQLIIGGPAAARIGEEQVIWMLEEPFIKENMGMISFHDFDNPEYPHEAVTTYQKLLNQYNANDIVIVRSSFVPEYEREKQLPGTLFCSPVAHHLIGALQDGIEAMGLWEIQNKTDEDDVRYWFDEDEVVNTAGLYKMMSNTLKLGKGNCQVYESSGLKSTSILAARNTDGDYVVVLADDIIGKGFSGQMEIVGLPDRNIIIETYKAGENHDGTSVLSSHEVKVKDNKITLDVDINKYEVAGFLIKIVN